MPSDITEQRTQQLEPPIRWHTNGRVVWVSVKMAPILLDGKLQGYVGNTLLKQADDTLHQAKKAGRNPCRIALVQRYPPVFPIRITRSDNAFLVSCSISCGGCGIFGKT